MIDQVLRLRQPGETHTSYIRLFTRYRADGAVISVRRAETESAARNAAVVPGHEVTRNFAYDTVGNRIGHTDADSDNPADSSDTTRHWRYLYNRLGELAAVRDPRGCGQDFFYDRAGRLIAEDYIGCGEAQASGDLTDETVPAGSMGYDTVPSGRQADVRYFFDTFPAWAEGADTSLPADREAYSMGRATGSSDRAQRSAIVYDARGQAIWAARQMALLPEAAELDVTTFTTALPAFPEETATQATRVWDEVNTYVSMSRYDNAGRGIGIELPSDPDWMLYGDATDPETPPTVGGAIEFDERGLPTEASLVVEGIATRVVSLTYDHFGRVTDTEIGNEDHGNRTHVDYDVRHRPVQARFKRELTDASADPDDVLPRIRYPYWYLYTWDAASNLTRITDQGGYANGAFQDGYRQRTVHVTHDSLYRVAQVDFTYRAQNGQWGPHDAATDWRAQRTRVNADGRTHRDADPMDREPVRMASEMPAERVQNITYAYDWLANMTEWKDDANAFYERSIGDVGNGAGHANARPSALYVATNISYDEPTPDALADRGGYVEVQYGAGGNVTSFTVHGQCRDASPTNVCFAEDVQGTSPDAGLTSLRARCVCDAATEQHVQLRWDELNRLVEARRYDRETGQWEIAVRQRHVYDGGNVRMVKETIDVDQTDPTRRQRIALGVIPGDFDRVGVYADHDALEPSYKGAAVLNTETQYSLAGARMVRARGEEAGLLKARYRLTYALTDQIKSTSVVIDLDSGELLETGTFYPNGARETHRSSSKSSLLLETVGFTGKEEDEEVGLTYFGERWLISRIGRWASVDPLAVHTGGGGEPSNAYHYISGNLLQGNDPLGLCDSSTTSCVSSAIGAGGSAGGGGVVQAQESADQRFFESVQQPNGVNACHAPSSCDAFDPALIAQGGGGAGSTSGTHVRITSPGATVREVGTPSEVQNANSRAARDPSLRFHLVTFRDFAPSLVFSLRGETYAYDRANRLRFFDLGGSAPTEPVMNFAIETAAGGMVGGLRTLGGRLALSGEVAAEIEIASEIAGAGATAARTAPFNPSGSMVNCVNGVCAFLNSVRTRQFQQANDHVAQNLGRIATANSQISARVPNLRIGAPQAGTLNTARQRQFFIVYPGSSSTTSGHVLIGINNRGRTMLYDPQTHQKFFDISTHGPFVAYPVIW